MDVKKIREKLAAVLKESENDTKYRAFLDDYTMLLDEVKVNTDTANLAIEAVKLDQGNNFLDIFAGLDKKQVKDAWKIILNCGELKKNIDYGTFELMCSFAASSLVGLLKKCRTWDFDISDMIPDEKLLDEYEQEIELLENKADKTDGENKYLQELLLKERKLIQLIPEDEHRCIIQLAF